MWKVRTPSPPKYMKTNPRELRERHRKVDAREKDNQDRNRIRSAIDGSVVAPVAHPRSRLFDNVAGRGENLEVFGVRVRLIGIVLVAALGWSATMCADSVQACGMRLTSPHATDAMPCCKSAVSGDDQSTAAQLSRPAVPIVYVIRWVVPAHVIITSADRRFRRLDTSPPRSSHTPTYVLDSVFLL